MTRRGWIVINMCYLCRANLEMRDHIFRECSYTKQLRQYIIAAIPSTRQSCQSYLSGTTDIDILTEESDMSWRQMELTTIFVVWCERCRRIFAEALQDIPDTVREIFREYKQWFCSWVSMGRDIFKWDDSEIALLCYAVASFILCNRQSQSEWLLSIKYLRVRLSFFS
jgi:hypothetical protein